MGKDNFSEREEADVNQAKKSKFSFKKIYKNWMNNISITYKNIMKNSFYEYNRQKKRHLKGVRIIFFVFENYNKTKSNIWSFSLAYYSLLSIVPILGILFSIGKGLGINEMSREVIIKNSPLPEDTLDVLLGFADNVIESAKGGLVAGAGFIFLGWTIIRIFTLIEASFNEIWGVTKGRDFVRKITDYFSVVMLFPVVALVTGGFFKGFEVFITKKSQTLGQLFSFLPVIFLIFFFTFIYLIVPNIKVRFKYAFIAGFFTTILFNVVQYIFVQSQILIISNNQVYGSFAAVPIFIIWQKTIWFIILLGVHLSFILQNSYKFSYTIGKTRLNYKSKRELLFITAYLFVKNYEQEGESLDSESLANYLGVSIGETTQILDFLVDIHILSEVKTNDEESSFYLNKNINTFTLGELIDTMESRGLQRDVQNMDLKNVINEFRRRYESREYDILIKDFVMAEAGIKLLGEHKEHQWSREAK